MTNPLLNFDQLPLFQSIQAEHVIPALDVILKPYGFGYRVVGDTIVISRLENIITVEGIEPLSSKVFTLSYLDAYDIKDVVEAQLSARGKRVQG